MAASGEGMLEGQPEPAIDLRAENAALREALARQVEAARQEEERLTVELGHRVKNTLSMVQALANQTFKGVASAEEKLPVFGSRVTALARANDAIFKQSWTTATLGSVAPCVLEPHGEAFGPISIEGPEVRIGASAALSFAMALHELASNAKRFGAWSGPHGSVALAWHVTGDTDAELHLRWTEQGGPPVEAPASRGFGLRFADQSLRSAFGRNVVFDFRAEGLECRVRAPMAALAA